MARIALRVFAPKKKRVKRRRLRHAAIASALFLALPLQSCTTMRIIRHREPGALDPIRIFPQRTVHHADNAFHFARASEQRNDLDTISVRNIDFRPIRFADYFRERRINAFVVIRNDTILYERYAPGFSDTTHSSSFSAAKSVTSALLGLALQNGAVHSLDDPITRYIPELSGKADFQGITVRNLLEMKSGFAYTRTNGSLWHDFRSSDAQFFYTTNLRKALTSQHREDPPGTRWAYKDSDTDLLAWVLERATGQTLAALLENGIWRKIGTERDASFDLDHPGGSENAASGLNATARDFARFARLYLNDGVWNGQRILSHDWIVSSTTRDEYRSEPEVATWWLMQHRNLWWIPEQNWDAERDFFADGSHGQRIYVNPPLHTIIVQLADESAQDFPFRKIAHYLASQPYTYPRLIANQLYASIKGGASADSVRTLYANLLKRMQENPAGYSYSRASMGVLSQQLDKENNSAMAALIRQLTPPSSIR